MKARSILAVLLAGSAMASAVAGQAGAQQPPGHAARGQAIAEKLCASCHAIGSAGEGQGASRADLPSFAAIAKRRGRDREWLAQAMMAPHPPMPDASLTNAEIADIAAYILSLRTP